MSTKEFLKQLQAINTRTIIYPMISILFLLIIFTLMFKTIDLLANSLGKISNTENLNPETELINFKIEELKRLKILDFKL